MPPPPFNYPHPHGAHRQHLVAPQTAPPQQYGRPMYTQQAQVQAQAQAAHAQAQAQQHLPLAVDPRALVVDPRAQAMYGGQMNAPYGHSVQR